MTVCTAAIFRWVYDSEGKDVGPAIITASDRMLTDEGLGIQFERDYTKVGTLTPRVLALVASSIPIHSAIMKGYIPTLQNPLETDVPKVARGYAQAMRDYRAERAAEIVLSIHKLNNETFLTRQKELNTNFVLKLADEMADYKLNAEALVVGCDDNHAHLYHIDSQGILTCHDDIGFVSAGIGGIHSSAQFMRAEYTNRWPYYWALFMIYIAKKSAEAAPGCGPRTDMHFVNRLGSNQIDRRLIEELDRMWDEAHKGRWSIFQDRANRLAAFDKKLFDAAQPGASEQPTEPEPPDGKPDASAKAAS